MTEEKILPRHIAIIPDGNRRWSQEKGLSKREGYAIGIQKIDDVLHWCRDEGVEMLTMWGFSSENFRRDEKEIGELFELFKINLLKVLRSSDKDDVRIRFFGRLSLLPKEVQVMIKQVESLSGRNNPKHQLNLLLSYGGRNEIVDAVNSIIAEGAKEVDEKSISEHLYTKELPDPDLVIRTSGEQRLSGLMPWQTCYSEFYFTKKLWPDFNKEDLREALEEYARRKRRYGK
ncbi:TPA: di-trans,poly-cis-decaprenylcistransferase [Candidatus Micrarchaeota archaeon]|nr:di-trans,poly-cis-decaprenylcistransferase [Candidatus Micrarchaeota archaeon]